MRVRDLRSRHVRLGALAGPVRAGRRGPRHGLRREARRRLLDHVRGRRGRGEGEGPKGETTRKVDRKDYVEVTTGPRNGMFINKSGNDRDGEAFVLASRPDRDLHVYGTGRTAA